MLPSQGCKMSGLCGINFNKTFKAIEKTKTKTMIFQFFFKLYHNISISEGIDPGSDCTVKVSESYLKVAIQILGRKLYKNTKKSSLYSQSLLIFIYETTIVESHLTTREIRDLLRPRSTQTGSKVYFFYMSSSLIYILKIHRRSFKHSVQ